MASNATRDELPRGFLVLIRVSNQLVDDALDPLARVKVWVSARNADDGSSLDKEWDQHHSADRRHASNSTVAGSVVLLATRWLGGRIHGAVPQSLTRRISQDNTEDQPSH